MGSMMTEVPELQLNQEVQIPPTVEPSKDRVPEEVSIISKYVVFCIGKEKEKMYGLKTKLIAKSQIFYEVVFDRKEISYPQFRPVVFRMFLKYINTDDLCFDESHVSELLRLAFLYEIPQITAKCVDFAKKTLNLDNCVKYHLAASLYELGELQHLSFKFILRQGQAFLTHPSFLDLDPLTLGSIIGRDDFNVIETDLFRCILAWVGAECRRLNYPCDRKELHRRVSGNLFKNIRYSLMTPREFRTVVIPTGILGPADIEAIHLRHKTHPNSWEKLPPSKHLDRQRRGLQTVSIPLYEGIQFGYRRISSPNVMESVRFLTSQDVILVGIEFFGPARNGSGSSLTSFKIKYQIENEFFNFYWKTLPENATIVTPDDFQVDLPYPYKIEAQHSYKLTVWIEGQMSQFGTTPVTQTAVILNDHFISFLFSNPAETPLGVIKSLFFQTA